MRISEVTRFTKSTLMQCALPLSLAWTDEVSITITGWYNYMFVQYGKIAIPKNSNTQETSIRLGTVGERRQREVMETGRDGRFGSTPGRFEGIGFCAEKEVSSGGLSIHFI